MNARGFVLGAVLGFALQLQAVPADKAGFRAGDVILQVGGVAVASPREVTSAIREQDADSFEVVVMRNRERTSLTVTMKSAGPGGAGSLRRNIGGVTRL